MSGKAFAGLMTALDYPMLIVTARAGPERSGCLLGFATQVSIHPARFLVAISEKNHTHGVALEAEHLGVHFAPADDTGLARLFGGETGDDTDKFARCRWHDGPEGVPILDDCENWFVGRIVERERFGDHTGHLLEPVAAQHGSEGRQFMFHRAQAIEPGHRP